MRRLLTTTAIRTVAPSLAALVAGIILAPATAEAGCGDYVMLGGAHARTHAMAGAVSDETDSAVRPTDGSTPVRGKCHGPSCTNGSIPPAAPMPELKAAPQRWAIEFRGEAVELPALSFLLAEPAIACADGFGLSLLRPPR